MNWRGYKDHLPEILKQDAPNLITRVETSPSIEQDNLTLERIHSTLQEKQLLPDQYVVDAGYISRENLVSSEQKYYIDLLDSIFLVNNWRVRYKNAFDLTHCQIDWGNQIITCQMGKTSSNWGPGKGPRGKATIQVQFRKKDCFLCKTRERCTHTKKSARCISLHTKDQQIAVQIAGER